MAVGVAGFAAQTGHRAGDRRRLPRAHHRAQAAQGLSANASFRKTMTRNGRRASPSPTLQPGENSLALALPLLPVGKYECQVMLKQDGKVLDSTQQTVELDRPGEDRRSDPAAPDGEDSARR